MCITCLAHLIIQLSDSSVRHERDAMSNFVPGDTHKCKSVRLQSIAPEIKQILSVF